MNADLIAFLNHLNDFKLGTYKKSLADLIEQTEKNRFENNEKARLYQTVIDNLPYGEASCFDLDKDRIKIGNHDDLTTADRMLLHDALTALCPWRKGPFDLFGIQLDSEWNSALKWNRLKDCISPLKRKKILDIGSSCGYYMFRMLAQAPEVIIGIEPYLTFYFQYQLLDHYIQAPNLFNLPVKLEEMPVFYSYFDTVFCMGILYHRRSPIDTLIKIHDNLKSGGELVLETLIIEDEAQIALFPRKRYAKMNNVFFIPTISCLENWLLRARFDKVSCVDVSKTTLIEQRKTKWIQTESLEDFLDPTDTNKTIEGYPAPVRAMIIATAK